MKRRDFVYGSTVAVGAALTQSDAQAQTAPVLSATRTFQLFDGSSSSGPAASRDVIFDGQNFVSLSVASGMPGSSSVGTVTATDPSGNRLWSCALPSGRYWSLGTHQGMVVISAPSAMLLLDPQTGKLTSLGPGNYYPMRYAGDSTFFTVANQQGEIWTLGSSFTQKAAGIKVQALTGLAPAIEYLQSGGIAVVSRDGVSMAVISVSSGSAIEHQISSDLVANSRNSAASMASQSGANMAVITAIGGDQSSNILAFVSGAPIKAGARLIQMDSGANVSYVANLQLPLRTGGVPILAAKLVGLGSEIGVVSAAGAVTWYSRPAA